MTFEQLDQLPVLPQVCAMFGQLAGWPFHLLDAAGTTDRASIRPSTP